LAGGNAASVRMNIVDTDYFRTAGVRLLIGREFSAEDTQNKPHVAIVNDALARSFWPRDQALGRKFYFRGDSRAEAVVIGVARNTQWLVLGETGKPMLFLPSSQRAVTPRTLYIYTTVRPELLIPAMKREVARLDREVMPYDIKTMDTHIYEGQALLAARTAAALAWIFGLMALALSATGVYGLISHSIGLRLREMGIRRALGASRWHVLREAGGRGLMLAVTGVTLGLGMAAASLRLLRAVLYEIGGETPWVFVGCGVLLLLCGFTAVYLSSRRAFRPELATVLRCE
jgi:predicted lysophospholipase L1 biosynthesis ABC-type transport system permease subunit